MPADLDPTAADAFAMAALLYDLADQCEDLDTLRVYAQAAARWLVIGYRAAEARDHAETGVSPAPFEGPDFTGC